MLKKIKIIIENLLCAINELAHGLCPQETVSSEDIRITQISTQTWKIGNSSYFPWSGKAVGSSVPCVSLIILGSYLTSLSLISRL